MLLFFICIQMVGWSSHLENILWRPRCWVQTARVWPLRPPCARGIAIFAAFASCSVSHSDPVWRDGDKCLSAQSGLNRVSWLCLPNENQLSRQNGTYSSRPFLVSNTVAQLMMMLRLLILHKVWAVPRNTWSEFWNKMWFLHWTCLQTCNCSPIAERILAWGINKWDTHSHDVSVLLYSLSSE